LLRAFEVRARNGSEEQRFACFRFKSHSLAKVAGAGQIYVLLLGSTNVSYRLLYSIPRSDPMVEWLGAVRALMESFQYVNFHSE
jgi:hypothetical protein